MSDWTSPVDIRPDHLEMVQDILREHLPAGFKVWVFGSRANWTTKDSSDLDLAVEGAGCLDHKAMVGLEVGFEESDLPYTVDVVDLNALSPGFREIVEGQRVLLPSGNTRSKGRGERRKLALGDVAQIVMGQSPLGETVSNDQGVALLNGPTEFGSHHPTPVQFTTDPRKTAEPGDILFCVRGSTTGRMNWADQEYAIGRGIAAIRHREEPILQPLVRGVIEIELPELLAQATGSTFPNVSASQLAEIPYPNLDGCKQRAIAQILGALDDKIELNRRMNQTLEEMARAIFQDWFVDFGPVRAKLEGQEPYLPAELWDLFPDRLVDSELGEIPEGWVVRKVGEELAELISGQRPRGGAVETGVPSVGAENVLGIGRYDFSREKYIPPGFFDRLKAKGADVRNGDVLLYKDGAQIGRKTYFDGAFPHAQCAINEHAFILRLRNRQAQRYLFFWLDQSWMTQEIIALNSNSAQPGINQTGVRGLPFLVPPTDVLAAFDDNAGVLTNRIFVNCHASCTLAALWDALLPKLVSGEVCVGEELLR